MVPRTYPESFRVIAQKTVGGDSFYNSIFRKAIENRACNKITLQ